MRNGMHSSDNETRLNKKKPRPPTCDMIIRVTTVSMKISFVLRNPRNLGGRDVTRMNSGQSLMHTINTLTYLTSTHLLSEARPANKHDYSKSEQILFVSFHHLVDTRLEVLSCTTTR